MALEDFIKTGTGIRTTAQSSASILIYDRGHSLHNCNRRNKDKQHTLLLALTINSLMFINMMGY